MIPPSLRSPSPLGERVEERIKRKVFQHDYDSLNAVRPLSVSVVSGAIAYRSSERISRPPEFLHGAGSCVTRFQGGRLDSRSKERSEPSGLEENCFFWD